MENMAVGGAGSEELRKYVLNLLNTVDGLHAIILSDREGVALVKVTNDSSLEPAMRSGFISTFGMATEQASKLGLDKNKKVICIYNNYQVIQINQLPILITMIASSTANTGFLLKLEEELAPLVQDLRGAVNES